MDKKDYFDKYFQMDTILIIFFYKYIILVLNSEKKPYLWPIVYVADVKALMSILIISGSS